jgi:glycyl-tRNA synthetase beta chain
MTAQNLLVELFVEELPPKALRKLGDAFGSQLLEQLKAQGLAGADAVLTTFASPRRLAAHVTAVLARAADKAQSHKLMPVSVGLDASGQPTPALLKRLAALGADASAVPLLQRRRDGKAEALFHDSIAPGVALAEGLQKALLDAIAKLPIPKVMSYQLESGCALPGWTSVSFVRPAHGLVALHGSTVVPVQALGLEAGCTTQGHRFEAARSPVTLPDADSYATVLARDGAVIAGFDARRAEIVAQLAAAAAQVGGGVRPIEDDALLDEVTALVERPNVLVCSFEAEFLGVPQECLILTMKANQKYFPLLDAAGKLTNKFLVVSNIRPADASAVIGGNERVVRPRLADAKFFFDQDRKRTLASRVDALGKVVYHNKLGTQGERAQRVQAIARDIARRLGDDVLVRDADVAATLAKADLLTDMVGEFPELQGTMGRYYAQHDGLSAPVADAIEDHYRPRFAGDALPRGDVGVVVALADKLETLVGMFGIGNLPTGDKDPFALRRHALGVLRMLVERALPLDLPAVVAAAGEVFGDLLPDAAASNAQLLQFVDERLSGYLREGGYSAQEVDAVITVRPAWGELPRRLEAARAFARLDEAPAIAAANKRIANILKKAPEAVDPHVSELLLSEPAERALHAAMGEVVPRSNALFDAGDYTGSLQALAVLRTPVDAFFDGVMVNAEQLDVRLNRLGLLKSLHGAMNRVADLSRLAS